MYHFCCWNGRTPPTRGEVIKLPGGISLDDARRLVRAIAVEQTAENAPWYLGTVWCGAEEDGKPRMLFEVHWGLEEEDA